MKKIYLLFLAVSSLAAAQTNAIIVDDTTKEPIPYVNISSEGNIQLSADEKGSFNLPALSDSQQLIHFSAVGYRNAALKSAEIKDTIYLTQHTIELDTVVISSKKKLTSTVVNPIKKSKNTFFGYAGGSNGSLLYARYIPYEEEYSATPFVDKIKFKVRADNDNTFNIRLYSVSQYGSPGEYLTDENILVTVKAGQKQVEIDFSDLSIQIPKEGFFIALEHIAIKSNRLGEPEGPDKYPAHLGRGY